MSPGHRSPSTVIVGADTGDVTLLEDSRRASARPRRLNVTPLGGDLYKIEVDESLENGEYGLTPEDSNQVFCFQVF